MKTAINTSVKSLLLASLLSAAAFSALAQTPPAGPPAGGDRHGMRHHGPMDPAKMQEMMLKHQAALKEKLKITPAQEAAWTSYTAAMKPPADMGKNRETMRAEMDKLTTPERIDKMKTLRAQRDAEMDKRTDATKTFYAVLSPEQKKVFDTRPMHGERGGHGGPGHKR